MINNERIVPITTVDYLSMIATVMKLNGTTFTVAEADGIGTFTVTATGNAGNKLANEPVISCNFAESTTAAVVYFVPDFNYKGFEIDGVLVSTAGATVKKDGVTLYTATLSSGTVTIDKVSP